MSRLTILLVLLAVVLSGGAVAKDKKKRLSKKEKAALLAEEEEKELIQKAERDAPGYMRWFKSVAGGRGAQMKINRVDTSHAPELRLHVSLLTLGEGSILQPINDPNMIKELIIYQAEGEDQNRPEELVTLKDGKGPEIDEELPEDERPPGALMMNMEDAGVPLDVVVVGAGHAGYQDVEQLESNHREAVKVVLSRLGDAAANVILYGPMLYTYRSFSGLKKQLSRYDEGLRECETRRLKYRLEMARFAADDEADPSKKPQPPPCGLHLGKGGDIKQGVDKIRFRGKHGRLFGLSRDGMNECGDIGYTTTAIRHADLDVLEQRTMDAGAFEEALRMLLQYGRPGSRKAIVIIGDGRDGYLYDDRDCRRLFTTEDKFCGKAAKGLRGNKARAKIQECVQEQLDRRAKVIQDRFRMRAGNWIALCRAAGIRVFGLAYAATRDDGSALSHEYERDRIELLSYKTGGTYREVFNPRDAGNAARAIADELTGEHVLVVGSKLKSLLPYKVRLKATVRLPKGNHVSIQSPIVEFEAPFMPSGFGYWFKQKNKWLKDKVGTILYWVIIVLVILLVLLLLWLIFKMFKAVVMKVVKAVSKKGKDAAKGAAKGAKK